MDLNDNNINNNNYMWDWQDSEYLLDRDSRNDVSNCLWDEFTQSEGSLMYMLDEQTPIKDCTDFGQQVSDVGDNTNKGMEESRETAQLKRRRMLQFTSDCNDNDTGKEEFSSFLKSRVLEDLPMEDESSEWNSQWNLEFQDTRCVLNSEAWNQPSEGWLADCFNESEMHCSTEEMNDYVASDDQVDISEYYNISPEVESHVVQETSTPAPPKTLKGRRSYLKTPTKLTTSVAYPFALIKPCEVQGDVTLKDINQRIHAPPPSRSKHIKDENPSISYPTSAFSGKPVVVKTKIRTEGGKGSITIMRTKG